MKNEMDILYQKLIEQMATDDNVDDTRFLGKDYEYDEDDSEDFLTSKEIVQIKEKEKEKDIFKDGRRNGDGIIEERLDFKRYTKRHQHKYTDKEMADIRSSCERTIVHDYGEHDIYHLSDEERKENDMLAEISLKLACLKRTYRKVDQYIEAMRTVMQAWNILEKYNFIHTREEFYEMIAEGRIVSNRIIMPKLKRMDQYNIDKIIQYISNPELDPQDLVPQKDTTIEDDSWYDEFLSDEEIEEKVRDEKERLLSLDDMEYIVLNDNDPPEIKTQRMKNKYIKGYDNSRRLYGRNKKSKLSKKDRYIAKNLHDILNKIQNDPSLNRDYMSYNRSYLVTNSMFTVEEKEEDVFDNVKFEGSWADKNAVELYDIALREELLKQHPAREKYLTFADRELQRFWKLLEDNGFNTIDLRSKVDKGYNGSSDSSRVSKEERKENEKMEASIIQRITKLNGDAKFKKLVSKAEKSIENYYEKLEQ